jgi:hypothetical protein
VLRDGRTLVFEPLDADFPTRARQRLEPMLAGLYRRGALRGASAQEAFAVVVDEALNPPTSRARGRFVVELRVAPARPLALLRLLLVQRDGGALTLEEAA